MKITLYKSLDPINKIKKTLTKVKDVQSVKWLNGTDMMNPTILLTGEVPDANYVYIDKFHRYYFINDISVVREGLYQLSCGVDVLHTYADEILANDVVTERQENRYNTYLNDEEFLCYNYTYVQQKTYPSGFDVNPTIYIALATTGGA